MNNSHFYHSTTRKLVTVFGTLFNNIQVVRRDQSGKVINIQRVPLAYGPKQKFLARLDEQKDLQGPKIAIKLPRMSFELTQVVYDAQSKTNRNNEITVIDPNDPNSKLSVRAYAPYRTGMQLSIMASNQDDALQIIEQILPYFQPEYTVTMLDVEGMDIPNDIPIVLTSVAMNEEYEGDLMTRRAIIYTLDFELRTRYYGPVASKGIIKQVITRFLNFVTGKPMEEMKVSVNPLTATETQAHTILESLSFFPTTGQYDITVSASSGSGSYTVGETVIGSLSGAGGQVVSYASSVLTLTNVDGIFRVGETVTGASSHVALPITGVTPTYV